MTCLRREQWELLKKASLKNDLASYRSFISVTPEKNCSYSSQLKVSLGCSLYQILAHGYLKCKPFNSTKGSKTTTNALEIKEKLQLLEKFER